MEETINTETAFSARAIEGVVGGNPKHWQFEKIRLKEILERRFDHTYRDNRKIRDMKGYVIEEAGELPARPVLTFSRPVYDSGTEVARIEIEHSIFPLVARTVLFGICFSGAGIIIFLVYYIIPLKIIRQAYDKLQKSESFFKEITDNSSDIIFIMDENGCTKYCSRSVERFLGYKPEELIGRSAFTLIHPDDLERAFKDYSEALLSKDKLIFNAFRVLHKDGSERYLEGLGKNLLDNPLVSGFIMNIHDSTERKRMEEELQESELSYRQLYNNVPVAIYRIDFKTGRFSEVNDVFCSYSGYSREELTSLSPYDILTEESRKLFTERMEKMALGIEVPETVEYKLVDKSGKQWWLHLHNRYIYDADGHVVASDVVAHDITQIKQSEDILRESERKYKLIAEKMNDIVWIADMDLKVSYVTPSVHKILGFTQEETKNQTPEEKVTHDSLSLGMEIWARELAIEEQGHDDPERTVSVVLEYYHKDGSTRWLDTVVSGIRDDQGVVTGIHGVCRDITKRKLAEDALSRSEEKYRTIIENIEDGYAELDLKGNFLFVNNALCKIDGYPKDELIKLNYRDIMDEENAKIIYAAYHKVFITGESERNFEYEIITKNGFVKYLEMSVSPIKDADNRVIAFRGIVRDRTERKKAEETLRKSEESYTKLVNSIPDVIVRTDLAGNILFVNDNTLKTGGYSLEEIQGHNLLKFISPENHDEVIKDLLLMRETRLNPKEINLLVKDGREIPFEVNANFLHDENGKPFAVVFVCRDISERKRAENLLKEKDERFKNIAQHLPGVIYQFYAKDSGEYGMNYISAPLTDAAKIISNIDMTKLDTVFPGIVARIHEEDRNRFLTSIHEAVKTISPWNFQGRIVHSGAVIWIQGLSVPKRYEDQTVFDGIFLNITERKLAEEKSRESEEKFREIFMTTPNGIAIISMSDGTIVDVNKGFEDIIGWKREQVIGVKTTDPAYNFWVDLSERSLMLADLKAGSDVLNHEFEFRRSDGSVRTGICSARPINIGEEGCIIFILQDITERKLAEEKFHKIFMTTPDCITITRLKDGLITDVNKGFEDIVGWKREIAIGTKSSEPPLNFWVDISERYFLVSELATGRDVHNHEFEFRRSDGSVRSGIYSARPINIDGEESLIFILKDITEQKRMEKELVESNRMKIMSQIASGVAHEVRNPLHAIQAISEAMAVDMDENSDYQDYLMHIKAQVGRLSHLMNDLLDLGKPIQPSQFGEALLTDIAAASLRYWIEAHPRLSQKVKIVNNLQGDDLVLVDTGKIQQVIINLMDNAIQHSPQDEEILLEIGKASENYLMVKVTDKGAGIKSQDQPMVFEPFYTTRKSGTGLGLSLCKHIVESHGGTIEIVNNENTPGCTARFTLPVYYNNKERK